MNATPMPVPIPDELIDRVLTALDSLTDPEIPVVTLRELGILRDVRMTDDGLEVVITPTYSGCPAMGQIEDDVRATLAGIGIDARVVTRLSPAWTTDWMSDAAKEKGKLAIGNVINTQPQYPDTVVASALWNMEPTVDRAIKLVKEGKFAAEDYGIYSTMKYKGSELAPLGTFEKKVPADIVAKVKAKEADILAGKFTVKVDDSQPKSTAK